jgi:TolB protein
VTTTDQAPSWSPDGERLLVWASRPAIFELSSRTFTPLTGDLVTGMHFRWSGDGTKLVYATAYCALEVAGSDGDAGVFSVPVLGDRQPVDNPDGLAACKPTSVDVAGARVTVPLQTTGETGADGPDTADAVVDTLTGDVVPIPVTGSVVGAVFDSGGNLLVRSRHDDTTRLSMFDPEGKLLVEATEPAALHDLDLLAYTH